VLLCDLLAKRGIRCRTKPTHLCEQHILFLPNINNSTILLLLLIKQQMTTTTCDIGTVPS
jgi:hypothetical protein